MAFRILSKFCIAKKTWDNHLHIVDIRRHQLNDLKHGYNRLVQLAET